MNTISVLDTLGVQRSRKAIHDWVQKADLQPGGGENPNQVALDESVIRINDQQYWLYVAVDPDTNKFPHIRLFATYTTAIAVAAEGNTHLIGECHWLPATETERAAFETTWRRLRGLLLRAIVTTATEVGLE